MVLGRFRRTALVLVVVAFVLTACSDGSFEGLGFVESWVDEGRTPEAERRGPQPIPVDPNVPRSIETVLWHNGWEPIVATEPQEVVSEVWASSSGEDSYVQVSPNELANALPGIKIPGTLPPEAQEITSQLVFAGTTGFLADDIVATFGFWNTRAYSVSRASGQIGVLSVAREEEAPTDPEDPSDGCARFPDASVCEPTTVGTHPAWWVTDLAGETLVWLDGDYRYELLRRPRLEREDVEMMAESMVLIAALSPPASS